MKPKERIEERIEKIRTPEEIRNELFLRDLLMCGLYSHLMAQDVITVESIKKQFYSELKFMNLSFYKPRPEEDATGYDLYEFDDAKLNSFTENELFLLNGMCHTISNIYMAINDVERQAQRAQQTADNAYRVANDARCTAQVAGGRTV
jgi:hypothetical protein